MTIRTSCLALAWLMLGEVSVLGCAQPQPKAASMMELEQRANFDLDCPSWGMSVYRLGERTIGVEGCGGRVTYIEQCSTASATCWWTLDSQVPRPHVHPEPLRTDAKPDAPASLLPDAPIEPNPNRPPSAPGRPIDPLSDRH